MSYTVTCEKCGEEVDVRGLHGHLRLGHGLTGVDLERVMEATRRDVPPSDDPDESAPAGAHASQIRAESQESTGGTCRMCGRSETVKQTGTVAQILQQNNQPVPEQMRKYEHYCIDCEYAFGEVESQ